MHPDFIRDMIDLMQWAVIFVLVARTQRKGDL